MRDCCEEASGRQRQQANVRNVVVSCLTALAALLWIPTADIYDRMGLVGIQRERQAFEFGLSPRLA